jgi:ABC-type multidrug transport system ATPase subunit
MTVTGRVGSLLELGAGFHPDFTGRENIYLSASIYGLKRQEVDRRLDEIIAFSELERFIDLPIRTYSAGMHMRLGFSVAVNIDAEVLLLDEVFAVGDEAFQRKCISRILEFKEHGKTIAFVSHSGAALERMCDRAILLRQGVLEYDGETSEAIRRYQEQLAGEEDPAERAAGLREWGSGEIRVTGVDLEGIDGTPREEFAAGDTLLLRIAVEAREAVAPPNMAVELRDVSGGLLASSERSLAELGWDGANRAEVRFEVDRLPLVEGRFQFNLALTDPLRGHRYHTMEKAAEFAVLPHEGARGFFILEGDWSLAESLSPRS